MQLKEGALNLAVIADAIAIIASLIVGFAMLIAAPIIALMAIIAAQGPDFQKL